MTIGEIIRTGGLPYIRGLPHPPWVPHLHVNVDGNENDKKVIGFYQQNKRLHVVEQKSKKPVNRLSLHRRCFLLLAAVVQTLDSAIHRVNRYRVDSAIGFPNIYPLDSDLSGE